MSTAPNKSPCCKCLRWFPRDDLTAKNSFCVRCAKSPTLRGAKCRWCRGNLPLPENGKEPTSVTCENCTKLQLKYGPPVHCTLCKLEASFKTKRGSKVCRRCDYCIQNYGKAKPCEKCKVKAAWEGGKIEKINGLTLCFICTFREKRKTKLGGGKEETENKNPKQKNGESKSKKPQKSTEKSKEKPASKKKPPKVFAEDPTEVKDKNAPTSDSIIDNLKISEIEVIETMQVDEHTSASLQVNDLLLKVKEMNTELARRKKMIEEKDVCISSLKGTLTSATTDHERQRKSWESRLSERISEFKAKILKLESE
ncbi:unnamed protein product [Oikopleura dioica]|uniref:Uncharacterized protein n=1 Tax=Oikopleura dioica TaxID=34765 RepID=E4Y366_OIKDI|nr:unnamed protein product [Oikopleura dioica]